MVIKEGSGRGKLVGGCMTLIRQLMGTPYEIETEGKIVFLEDLEEEPHAIDRFLSQLLLAGKLQKAAGIIIGQCMNCRPGDSHRNVLPVNYGLEYVLKERLSGLKIPIIYGLRIGHSDHKLTLPLGVMATLEAAGDRVRFQIEESALV
jgi:muramoyltetrapeptide carboxypeptidase